MSTVIVKIITVILKLGRLSVANVVRTVESVVEKMTTNTHFTTPNPTLATITTQKDELRDAAAAALNGSTAQKALVKVKLRTLLLSMDTLRAYVQTVANSNAETAEEVALSSGMSVKRVTPRKKRVFTAVNTNLPGQVKVFTGRVNGATMYEFEFTATPGDDKSWESAGVNTSATRIVSYLTSVTEYSFRWCSISKDGRSAWSNVITLVVM